MSDYMLTVVRLIEMEGSHGHVMSRQADAFSESEARRREMVRASQIMPAIFMITDVDRTSS
jgi:hypothetical protein